jgi:hypothetical protein
MGIHREILIPTLSRREIIRHLPQRFKERLHLASLALPYKDGFPLATRPQTDAVPAPTVDGNRVSR